MSRTSATPSATSSPRSPLAWTDTATDRPSRFQRFGLPLLLLLAVFGVLATTTEQEAVNTDAYAASAGAWRIATAGTPWFDGLNVERIDGTHQNTTGGNKDGQWLTASANGHVTAQRMAGPILVAVPFYWVLAEGGDESDFTLLPGGLAASALSALAVLLVFLAVRRYVPTAVAMAGSLAFAFATPTWSLSANGLWTHPLTQFGIAGAAYAASRNKWGLAGVFLAAGMLGRPHVALIAAALGLGVAWSRRDWRVAAGVGLPTFASLGLLAVWNRAVHGRWSIGGAYGDVVDRATRGVEKALGEDLLDNYLGFLLSADRGFLVWTPVVVLFIPALIRARGMLPDWSLWMVAGGLLYTFFQVRLNHFAGGAGFHGYRHGLELLTCLAPALILAAPRLGRAGRLAVPVVIAAQFAAFTLGATLEAYFVDLDDVWTDNSFWLALRYNPEIVGSWLAVCIAAGILVAVRFVPRTPLQHVDTPAVDPDGEQPARCSDSPLGQQ